MSLGRRFLRFQAVGALGIGVQLGTLVVLKELAGLHYLVATFFAVQAALLHNFAWHVKWTWAAEAAGWDKAEIARRYLRFVAGIGFTTLVTNLTVTSLLAGWLHVPYALANLAAIAAGGLLNFVINHRMVFRAY